MEPRIQYAKTKDGVSIAYWMIGEGPPLITLSNPPFSHIQVEWQINQHWVEFMSERVTYVRYDARGLGLSDREPLDFSVQSQVKDLRTVLDKLEFETCALMGSGNASTVAIAFAAAHPERVSHLILSTPYTRMADWAQAPNLRALGSLVNRDWQTYTETYARMVEGWEDGEQGTTMAEFLRASITQEAMQRLVSDLRHFDVSDLLADIKAPTLILHPEKNTAVLIDTVRKIASQIPDSQLIVTKGRGGWSGRDWETFKQAVPEFLGLHTPAEASPGSPQGTAIILFLDIAGSTALTTKLGDAAYRERERELDAALRAAITGAAGTPVAGKVLGDGVMAVFTSARSAIDAAQRCRGLGNEAGLPLHIGVHAGDVVREGNNVHGGAVQVASRVQSVAAPGEILVSDIVRGLARTSAGVEFEDRGEHELKGIAEPQRLFAVRAEGAQ